MHEVKKKARIALLLLDKKVILFPKKVKNASLIVYVQNKKVKTAPVIDQKSSLRPLVV